MSLDIPHSPFGVLTNDEERVVSLVREVIGKIRAPGKIVEMVLVEEALAEFGARVECDSHGIRSKIFAIRNARFFIQSCEATLGGLELVFIETNI